MIRFIVTKKSITFAKYLRSLHILTSRMDRKKVELKSDNRINMVIQRWQSVLLLITAAVMACFTFCSLGQIQLPEYTLNFTTFGFCIEGQSTDGAASGYVVYSWPMFIVSLLSALIPLVNIFMFKNLKLQKMLCLIEVLFILAVVGIGCVYGYNSFAPYYVSWSSLIIAPLLAFLADIFAYNRILSDERAIKDSERLR